MDAAARRKTERPLTPRGPLLHESEGHNERLIEIGRDFCQAPEIDARSKQFQVRWAPDQCGETSTPPSPLESGALLHSTALAHLHSHAVLKFPGSTVATVNELPHEKIDALL